MQIWSVLLLLALLLLTSALGLDRPDNQQETHPGNINAEVNPDEVYEHGEEIPFDYKEYTKHVDKDKDGFVSFEEHEEFFKKTLLAHVDDHEEWEQRIRDYY